MAARSPRVAAGLLALLLALLCGAALAQRDPAAATSPRGTESEGHGPDPSATDRAGAVAAAKKPAIKFDPIPFGSSRKRQMANYSKRHYGGRSWRLSRRQVRTLVLHYTAGPSYSSAWNTFASNAPALGERPGVCAQFIVDKDGTIYQLTRLKVRCRHTIGLNHRSIGIEMVQEDAGSPAATANKILDRRRQSNPAVRLVAWLKARYGVGMRDIIGHAMANDSRFFEDREGWRNDHADWQPKQVKKFRERVKRVG